MDRTVNLQKNNYEDIRIKNRKLYKFKKQNS